MAKAEATVEELVGISGHQVLSRKRFETDFGGGWPWGQSGAHSKKPRVVRGSEHLTTRLSELAGLVLAGQRRFEEFVLSRDVKLLPRFSRTKLSPVLTAYPDAETAPRLFAAPPPL